MRRNTIWIGLSLGLLTTVLTTTLLAGKPGEDRQQYRPHERAAEAELMATRIWLGTTSTSWATTTNWSGTTVPIDGDTVVVPATASNHLLTNLDRTGDTAGAGLHLAAFRRLADSTVKVGDSTNPLKCTATLVRDEGATDFYFQSGTGTSPTNKTTRCIINPSNTGAIIQIGSKAVTGADNITRLELLAGTVSLVPAVANGIIATEVFMVPIGPFDLRVTQENGARWVYCNMAGGELTGTYASIMRQSGGTVTINQASGVSGNVNEYYQFGGTSELSISAAATTPTGDAELWIIGGRCAIEGSPYGNSIVGFIYVSPNAEYDEGQYVAYTGVGLVELGEE